MSKKYYHPDTDFYRKTFNMDAPSSVPHMTEEELWANMKQLKPKTWILRGNQLEGMTEQGRLVQTIPTSHILVGTDSEGLPVFTKIQL